MLPNWIPRVACLMLLALPPACPGAADQPGQPPATRPAQGGCSNNHANEGRNVEFGDGAVSFNSVEPSPIPDPATGSTTTPGIPATQPAPTPAAQSTTSTTSTTQPDFHVDLRQTVEFLAGDALEGRYASSEGNRKAAELIANDFEKLGLKPLPGLDGYFQPFETKAAATVDRSSALAIGEQAEQLDKDFRPVAVTSDGSFEGPVVFAGYGISDAKRNYDDYAGLEVKGKVVLVLRYEPHDAENKSLFTYKDFWSPDATFAAKCKTAAEHGAAALLVVNPPGYEQREMAERSAAHTDKGQTTQKDPKDQPEQKDELMPFGGGGANNQSSLPVVQIKTALAEAMVKEGGAGELKELEAEIDKELKPESGVLKGVTARGKVALLKTVRNVVAVLPGKGEHADEYVVIGGHYDHLGRGGPGSLAPFSHAIHHGADDNASGTAAVLAMADDLAHAGPQPRSLIFIAFTAEEEGLIGSQHFVAHCPVPLDKIVYMLNLDMVGRMKGTSLEVGGAGTSADLDLLVKEAADGLPIKIGASAVGGKGGMGPSDHMTFALKKIPVLFFFTGLHSDYHRPTDTADKVNYWGMRQVVTLGDRMVESLARHPREQYVGKYDLGAMAHMAMSAGSAAGAGSGGGNGAALGVVPDYGSDAAPEHGVRISGTSEGSAAEKAGLRPGDVILGFGEASIDNLQELSDALARAKPGDKVHLTLTREGKKVETDAVLTARKG